MGVFYVYNDQGVDLINLLKITLLKYLESESILNGIEEITALDIINCSLKDTNNLLIIPGGRDIPYLEKLNGKGNENIKDFIKNGGKYLGICAGCYYASSVCDFERDTNLEVFGNRPLGFFRGIAKGCVFPGFDYNSTKGARIIEIKPVNSLYEKLDDDTPIKVYYDGGCELIPDNMLSFDNECYYNCEPLAYYYDNNKLQKIAIVQTQYGNGRAILSGVHPEYPAMLWSKDSNLNYNPETSLLDQTRQFKLFNALIELLIL